jgi:lipopolysaccharide/colanic/teichoic acid biosynthesis glycosyltransferase
MISISCLGGAMKANEFVSGQQVAARMLVAPKKFKYESLKRVIDILLASIILLTLFPLFILIAIAVRFSSPGPVLYKSTRIGQCGQPFLFLKFRSMYMDAEKRKKDLIQLNEKDGPIFKMKNDPRITPIGRFLRKFSLDELPQFISVLTGEMSMVGPRPPLQKEVDEYDVSALRRLMVKPGMTCYWQIMGRSDLTFDEMVELDVKYVEEVSFTTDLLILAKTPKAVLSGKGAY